MNFLRKFKLQNYKFEIDQKNIFFWLFFFYAINHGWIFFLSSAVFWDDWTLYGMSSQLISETFEQQGSVFNLNAIIHNSLLSLGPWFYRFLSFFMIFFSGIAVYEILKKHSTINFESKFVITLLYLILPFYSARVSMIVMPYTVSIFLFFTAWAILEKHRFTALVFFFLSFNTNSLLVFYALPFLDFFLRTASQISFVNLIKFCYQNIALTLLPFFYFFIEIYAYPPKDLFEGYNEGYSLANLLISPLYMIWNWMKLEINIFPYFIIFFLLSFFQILRNMSNKLVPTGQQVPLLLVGLSMFVLACFAYWVLGHTPIFNDWNSRHQLLLPLPTSIIIFSIIVASRQNFREPLLITFVSISFFLNINTYKDFYIDWKKQNYLIRELSLNEVIKNSDIIIFEDNTIKFNAFQRSYRNYEWNGLLVEAFGDEQRFGVDMSDFQKLKKGSLSQGLINQADKFKASEFNANKELYIAEVKISAAKINRSGITRKLSIFDPQIKLEVLNTDTIFLNQYRNDTTKIYRQLMDENK